MKYVQSTLIFLALCLLGCSLASSSVSRDNTEKQTLTSSLFSNLIQNLYHKLQSSQVQDDQSFIFFPPQSQKQKGLYGSDIKMNFIDKENTEIPHIFRETFFVFDNNMFVTNFVLLGLFEAADLGTVQLNITSIEAAVDALLTFKDKNQANYNSTPIYNFWSQINVNGTWQSYPSNLEGIMNVFNKLPPWIQSVVKLIGLQPEVISSLVKAFTIPPDNDDTGINLALGAQIHSHQDLFPDLAAKWKSSNSNYTGLYAAVKKYAYRPLNAVHPSQFSTNCSDIIDARSYYYLHKFIQDNKEYPLAFFSTWLLNQNDQIGRIVTMPFNTNNVDLTVNANSLFGMNNLLTTLPIEEATALFDDDLKGIYLNATKLIEYGISSGLVLSRPDLVLTYYPSVYDFFWFVSRNVHLLRTIKSNNGSLPFPELEVNLATLENVMLNQGTQQILSLLKNSTKKNQVFWEGFLGNFANKTRHEDALFSTAVTLNALYDLYSVTSADRSHRKFISNTPKSIKEIISKAANYLIENISLNPSASYINSFFSGSIKGLYTYPYWYPSNYNVFPNGTAVDPTKKQEVNITMEFISAFKGTVSEEVYAGYLNETWFQFPVPVNFTGFNLPNDSFPFWSSKAITDIFIIQALSKYSATSD